MQRLKEIVVVVNMFRHKLQSSSAALRLPGSRLQKAVGTLSSTLPAFSQIDPATQRDWASSSRMATLRASASGGVNRLASSFEVMIAPVNQDDVDRGIAQVLDQVQTSATTAHNHHALPLRGRSGGLDRWSHLRFLFLKM